MFSPISSPLAFAPPVMMPFLDGLMDRIVQRASLNSSCNTLAEGRYRRAMAQDRCQGRCTISHQVHPQNLHALDNELAKIGLCPIVSNSRQAGGLKYLYIIPMAFPCLALG